MPGISDRKALRNTILDSFILDKGTDHRLSQRGVKDLKRALRLRRSERDYFSKVAVKDSRDLSKIVDESLRNKYSGNHYVYKFILQALSITEDKGLFKECRHASVTDAFLLQGLLLSAKLPKECLEDALSELPELHSKVQARFFVLRSLYVALQSAFSDSGRHRGSFQAMNTKFHLDQDFYPRFLSKSNILTEKLRESQSKDSSIYSSTHRVGLDLIVTVTRLSDLIWLKLNHGGEEHSYLATSNHFDRMKTFLIQYSNVLLGLTLSYGSEIKSLGFEVATAARILLKHLAKMGVRDDLSPGEAGKAVTDLYKARMSQSPELPWDNFSMLLNTYKDARQRNALSLWEVFHEFKFDPDVMLNLSFIWKLCPQPDSDIRADFKELTEGLIQPNPISGDSAKFIELAFRRSYLIGALRDKRQPQVTALPGYTVANEVITACRLSRVNESDLREITFGMMEGIIVRVPEVFPSALDTSRLSFKDKSSSNPHMRLRREIMYRETIQLQCEHNYDMVIAESSMLRTDEFFHKLGPDITDETLEKALRATTNDILSSINEELSEVFREAEYKYRAIVTSLRKMADSYGSQTYLESLREWANDNPELLINTGTEPKLGEVHKRTVRIFYMFEKGMKTFLSQFERMSRIMDYYIRGAEIVKGDRAREKHMNILSSAHKSVQDGILSYQILFDLSKFSQKFNHRIIDAAAKVIGEACDYPYYQYISDIFKASYLYVSARNVDSSHVGVLGCYEGFLNFLWTGIHATVMDIALRECGRSGDLAAYSDDGLLMFTMRSNLESTVSEVQEELNDTVNSIIKTYKEYGLDFNLGKTIISRTLAEFLGVIQYKGKRLPTWLKELCKLGTTEGRRTINSLGGVVADISAQMEAAVKAGMPPFASAYVGYLEIALGPGRRLSSSTIELIASHEIYAKAKWKHLVPAIFLSLNSSFGGVRVQDILAMMTTADHDPISEMLQDLSQLAINNSEVERVLKELSNVVAPSNDYTELLNGALPISTTMGKYGSTYVQREIAKHLKKRFGIFENHPLSFEKAPNLHLILENTSNVAVYVLSSLTSCLATLVEYNKVIAPIKANSMSKLLSKNVQRSIQRHDTLAFKETLLWILKTLSTKSIDEDVTPNADMLYRKSYPNINFSPTIPSYRSLAHWTKHQTLSSYRINVKAPEVMDGRGTTRLLNTNYTDDLAPPLITTDINIRHIAQAPDVITSCTRSLYSEVVSAASQGHNITLLVDEILRMNGVCAIPDNVLSSVHDLRKITVANRKKSLHRVHWSTATRCNLQMHRLTELNDIMSVSSNVHYSLIVSVALSHLHFIASYSHFNQRKKVYYIDINPEQALSTKILPMKCHSNDITSLVANKTARPADNSALARVLHSVSGEVTRQIDTLRLDIRDNMILGRMNMLADFKMMGYSNRVAEPLKYALVWSLIHKMDNFAVSLDGLSGITQMKVGSGKLDSIPTSLANYALIYRTYKNFHKGPLSKVRSQDDLDRLISKQKVSETLYVASELGIIHTLDPKSLSSMSSLETYRAMLLAEGCEVVYYSLDTTSEDCHSDVVSHARARAVGRSLDVVISKMFSSKVHSEEVDLNRLTMMVIRGSVRGSVHRKEPFNRGVIRNWLIKLMKFGQVLFYSLPEVEQRARQSYDQRDWYNIPKETIDSYSDLAISLTCTAEKVGDASQYDQAIKFIKNLISWGYFDCLFNYFFNTITNPKQYIDEVIQFSVKPILSFVRTVSYSMAENVLRSLPSEEAFKSPDSDPLGDEISEMISEYGDMSNQDHRRLINCPPADIYRAGEGSLSDFTVTLQSPGLSEHHILTLLSYSIALPLLISAGVSSFSRIIDFSTPSANVDREKVENVIKEYSIPQEDGKSSLPLYIFRYLAEDELLESLDRWLRELKEEAMVIIEIPPAATPCSLGIIANITTHQLSYITTSVSSDLLGFSIYLSAIVKNYKFPREQTRARELRQSSYKSLGDAAMISMLNVIINRDQSSLTKIILTPLHQAGLPVNAKVHYLGELVHNEIEEELVDKLSVSFIETGKPSRSLMELSKVPEERIMYITRALMMRRANATPEVRAVSAAAYYYHGVYPHLPAQDLLDLFCQVLNMECPLSHIENAFRFLLDPLAVLHNVQVSDLPIGAQVYERRIPNLRMRRHIQDDVLGRKLRDFLSITNDSLLLEPQENPILQILRETKQINEDTLDSIMQATKPKQSQRRWAEEEFEIQVNDYFPVTNSGQNQYLDELRNQVMDNQEWDTGQSHHQPVIDIPTMRGLLSDITYSDGLKSSAPKTIEPEDDPLQRVYTALHKAGSEASDFDRILEQNPEVAQDIMKLPDDEIADAVDNFYINRIYSQVKNVGVSNR